MNADKPSARIANSIGPCLLWRRYHSMVTDAQDVEQRERKIIMIKKCLICDKDFDASRKDVLCCSKLCIDEHNRQRQKAYYDRYLKVKPECVLCGRKINDAKNGHVKYHRSCAVEVLALGVKKDGYIKGSNWNLMHRHGVSREEVQKKLYEVMKNDR